MAEGKINRHNHPLMVNARRESYFAGKKDGYKEGFEDGKRKGSVLATASYEATICAYKAIIAGFEKQAQKGYGDGFRSGYKAAKEDIQYVLDDLKPLISALEEKEVDK